MLSVLIPTYNYNACFLVEELHKQMQTTNILFEIICIDDNSKSEINETNQKINSYSNSSFEELKNNIGRSAIRNLLADKANYDWLLFLDADVMPVNTRFISNYLQVCEQSNNVFCGGLKYLESDDNKKMLRYKYGVQYEEIALEKRKKNSYKFFLTSNFLIQKEVFQTIQFEEKLKKYGREDLLFSLELKSKKYKINHLDNPVYHLGIDTDSSFVLKTKQAMTNIAFLEKEKLISNTEGNLLKIINYLYIFKLTKIVGRMSSYFEKMAIKKSSLFYLNCFKVSYLCYLKSKKDE